MRFKRHNPRALRSGREGPPPGNENATLAGGELVRIRVFKAHDTHPQGTRKGKVPGGEQDSVCRGDRAGSWRMFPGDASFCY